jgi:hypothetical protein
MPAMTLSVLGTSMHRIRYLVEHTGGAGSVSVLLTAADIVAATPAGRPLHDYIGAYVANDAAAVALYQSMTLTVIQSGNPVAITPTEFNHQLRLEIANAIDGNTILDLVYNHSLTF